MSHDAGRQARDDLIAAHCAYVKSVAARMIRSLALSRECFDELSAAGYLGLVEAAERYDPKQQEEFKSYAFLRIRGAILDALREMSGLSPKAARYLKALHAVQQLRQRMHADGDFKPDSQRTPAKQLALVMNYAAQGAIAYRLCLGDVEEEAVVAAGRDATHEDRLIRRDARARLRALVAELPERERKVIEQYYFEDRSFAEIVRGDGTMSKGWVSKLHARGLRKLKEKYESCAE